MKSLAPTLDPLFRDVSDGICVNDESGAVLYMNPAAERLLDANFSQAKGKPLCKILCGRLSVHGKSISAKNCPLLDKDADERSVTFNGEFNRHASFHWQESGFVRSETWKDLRVRCMKTRQPWLGNRKAPYHFVVIEDASSEMELTRRSEDWRNMVAHDLRAPLTSIYASLRIMQDGATSGEAIDPSMIDISVKGCQKMVELVELYLDISKLDAGLSSVKLLPICLLPAVQEAVLEQAALARERGISVSVSVPPELKVLAENDLLGRVLQNILNNALKYSPPKSSVQIAASAKSGGKAALSVKDQGPGIDPTDQPLIFDRYYQAKARREGRIIGTGLGLTFCREAVIAMGGDIRVESKTGSGSVFTVILPAISEASKTVPSKGGTQP